MRSFIGCVVVKKPRKLDRSSQLEGSLRLLRFQMADESDISSIRTYSTECRQNPDGKVAWVCVGCVALTDKVESRSCKMIPSFHQDFPIASNLTCLCFMIYSRSCGVLWLFPSSLHKSRGARVRKASVLDPR